MRKTYCDKCETEFTKDDHQPLFIVSKKDKTVIGLEVWNNKGYKGGDLCNKCTVKTIGNGEILSDSEMEALRYKWNH